MHMFRSLVPIPFLLLPLFALPQSDVPVDERWQCQIMFGTEFGPIDTYLDLPWSDASHFAAKSPKNADKRVFGSTKSTLGRLMKKLPKKGKLLSVADGTVQRVGGTDSVFATLMMPMVGKTDIKAVMSTGVVTGGLFQDTIRIGSITIARSGLFQKTDYTEL